MHRHALTYRTFGNPLETLNMEAAEVPELSANKLRVSMLCAPVNPSDLIPIHGAYSHRIALPAVAGYEGVGRVMEAPQAYASLIGKRVLPLRGEGTWQTLWIVTLRLPCLSRMTFLMLWLHGPTSIPWQP